MELQLAGKHALITGSSDGMGKAIALLLAEEGAFVVVHGRDEEKAKQVVSTITSNGGKAAAVTADLSSTAAVDKLADSSLEAFGGLDIVIHAAALHVDTGWMDTPIEQWRKAYDINVLSMVRLVQRIIPEMKPLGWGRIINLASSVATQPFAGLAAYSATKAALVNLSVSLAKELANTGITVNTVTPGIVLSGGTEKWIEENAQKFGWGTDIAAIEQKILEQWLPNPTGRIGRPMDIATLVAYLASPLSGYINGANLRVDGGSTVSIN